ncbi:MAG: PcfJ domain-containing protein [Paludibacteraceae bacterium]|nr:PcfJ domain-containing protein [Paludibacteraceae bacterium]
MKPITKKEALVAKLSAQLPSLTDSQRKWAEEHFGQAIAYSNKRNTWCSECGQMFKPYKPEHLVDILQNGEKRVTCPHCGKELKLMEGKYGTIHVDKYYYTIITTMKGFQVFRHYSVDKIARRGGKATFCIDEVVQNWVDEKGKETIIARDVAPLSYYRDVWVMHKDMSIKRKPNSYQIYTYDIDAYHIYPYRHYIPQMKRNGFKGDLLNLPPNVFAKNLLGNNEYEYLLKTNQLSVFRYLANRNDKTIPYKYAINICNRNNYIIKDAGLWYDMMSSLGELGKDLHNPYYICPSNLTSAHNRWLDELRKKREKEERERRIAEAMEWEERYREAKQKFFDLVISNGNIIVEVLKSVKEFEEEGTAMHHCVFACAYYKQDNSLILSAKDMNGNRIETIEVNLKTFTIMQSRGLCNKFTDQHEEIMNLVNTNMNKIQMLAASA